MVEAIVPRDRNGLLIRVAFLLALLGVGTGVFFKATSSEAASNDFIVSISDSVDPVPAGTAVNYTVAITDGAGTLVTDGFLTTYLVFDQPGPANRAQIGTDYTIGDPSDANWSCAIQFAQQNLWGCISNIQYDPTDPIPSIVIPVTTLPTARDGYIIQMRATVDSSATNGPGQSPDSNEDTETTVIDVVADLQLTKDDVVGTFIAGDLVPFNITVANLGPSAAPANIRVTDVVPAGLVLDNVAQPFNAGGGFMCSTPAGATAAGTTISCTRTSALLQGTSVVLTIPFRVGANTAAGPIVNTASVCVPTNFCFGSAGDVDPAAGNDTDTGTVNVGASFDLGVGKTASVTEVVAGSSFFYTVTWTGAGATPGQPGTINDVLTGPAGGTFTVVSGPGWACLPAAGPVTGNDNIVCTNPAVAAGGGTAATITVNVPANSAGGTYSNTAGIAGANPDPNPANNTAGPVEVDILVQADIQITKCAVAVGDNTGTCAAAITQVQTGQDFVYRIIATNAGPSAAPANTVSVGDSLPSQVAFRGNPQFGNANTTPLAAGWLCSPAPVVTNLGGQSVTCVNQTDVIDAATSVVINLPVEATAQAPAGQQQCNFASATVTSPLEDPDPSNNTNPAPGACVLVTTISDLGVTKVGTPDEVVPGGSITYSIVVTNGGPSPALNPILTDAIPAGTFLQSLTAPAGWTCRKNSAAGVVITPANAGGFTGTIYCAGPASMAVGASANFIVTVQADILQVTGASTITNTAVVNLPANQTINVEALCPQAIAGDPEDAPADATCGFLPDSATATTEVLEYDIFVDKTATVVNDPQGFDPLYVAGSVFAGEDIIYSIVINNLGPDDAPANVISLGDGRDNPLKLQGTVDLSLAPQFTCTVGPDNPPQFNKSLTCVNTQQGIPSGGSPAIGYTATVVASTPAGTLVCNSATAHVTPPGADTTLLNNESEVCNTVVTTSDLSVQKVAPTTVSPGTLLTYSIVVQNAGPGIALNPIVYDTVPADTTFQALTAPFGWTCVQHANNQPLFIGLPAGTVIRCQAPSLAVGSALFTLSVMVSNSPVGTTIDNDDVLAPIPAAPNAGACVVAGPDNFTDVNGNQGEINIDLNLANNCATASSSIILLAHLNVLKTALNPLYAGQGQAGNNPPYDTPALYRIEVTNTGPNTAANVVFTDLLPPGVTASPVAPILEYISGATSTVNSQATLDVVCATYNGLAGTETCSLGDLAAGQTLKFNVRVILAQNLAAFDDLNCDGSAANELGTQTCNRARFTSTSLEASLNVIPRPTINTFDDDKQTVSTKSDLAITKAAETLAGAPIASSCSGTGCEFNYVISVDNLGPSDTPAQVQFTDIFPNAPAGALKITGTTIPGGWTCDQFPAAGVANVVDLGTLSPVIVVCTSAAPIPAAGAAVEFTFRVEAQAAAVTGTVLVNNVCFWQNGTPLPPIDDPVLGNNCATNTLTINNGNTINGIKFIDLDGDGDPADVETNNGAGFEIFIDDGRGGGTAGDAIKNGGEPSAITGANGAYSISGLIGNGPWRVCESDRAGYTQTGVDVDSVVFTPVGGTAVGDAPGPNACATITFPAGAEPNKVADNVNFLNFQHFTISGFKFEDVDGDGSGVIEPNETGVDTPDFTLYVDYNDNGILDPGEPSSTQLPGMPIGDYRISNVGPCAQTANVCQVREVRTAGWIQTYPNTGVANPPITDANGVPLYPYDPDVSNSLNPNKSTANTVALPLVPGGNVPNVNFSNFKLVVVSGLKFNDLDADGQPREAGEPALAGFKTCWDFDNSGDCNAPEPEYVTAADGTYSYLVGPGTSFVFCENLQTSPSGWTATYPTADSTSNCHDPILADSGDVITNVTFGNFQNILRGFKWNDKALFPVLPDGAFDPDGVDDIAGNSDDETGLAGWRICAIPVGDPGQTPDCNSTRAYNAVTDAQGNWEIRDLPSGVTYRICEEPKVGWNQVYPANSCHFLTIPSTSGPTPADHIFGAFIPGTHSIPTLVSPVAPVPGTPLNFGNNSPLPDVDMSLTKSAPTSVTVGANLDFTFQVRNNSAFPATNVVFTDVVNTNLISSYVGTVSPTPGAWSCTFVSPNLTCTRTGQQPAATTETVRVRFLASLTPGGPYINSACVTADNPDPYTLNNCGDTGPAGTTVNAAPVPVNTADLKIDKSASPLTAPQQLGPNKIITYKIRVRNLGPSAATNVLITDVLKSGLLFQQWINKATYTCNAPAVNATGTVTCGKASVPNLGVNTIEFRVKTPNPVPQDGAGPNDAKVEQCTSLVLSGGAIQSSSGCSTSLNDSNPNNNTTTAVASLP